MAQDRGDEVMAVCEHIRLDPHILPDDALDWEPPGVDLGPQALHDHADDIGAAARFGGTPPLGARGGYSVTPGEVSDAMIGTGGWTLPRSVAGQHQAVRCRSATATANEESPMQGHRRGVRIDPGGERP